MKTNYKFMLVKNLFACFCIFFFLFFVFIQKSIAVQKLNSPFLKSTSVFDTNKNFKSTEVFKPTALLNRRINKKIGNFFESSLTRLPVMANGEVALPSNATNFHGGWNASVDSRTGSASFSITLGSFLFNHGQGRRDIKLFYSGSASPSNANPFGLGSEWAWNIGSEHLSTTEIHGHNTTDINLSDGHSFTLQSLRDSKAQTKWKLVRHKLQDVLIKGHRGSWVISTTTGLREYITDGYENKEETKDGQYIWLYYDHNNSHDITRRIRYICGHQLTQKQLKSSINACNKDGAFFSYSQNNITIHADHDIVLTRKLIAGHLQITSIAMPSLSSNNINNHNVSSKIYFNYDQNGNLPWLLHSVIYPTGVTSTFLYNNETSRTSSKIDGLPIGINNATLPVVTEFNTYDKYSPTHTQHIWYSYNTKNGNQHNYTGYQVGGSIEPGKDNLIDQPDNYTYSVTADNGFTKKTTTYNKYHLALQEIEVSDSTNKIIGKSINQYLPWKNSVFSNLSATFSEPIKISKQFFTPQISGLQSSKIVSKETKYNSLGQAIWKRNTSGEQMFIQYCPQHATVHCTTPIKGWPAIPLPEKIVVVPALYNINNSSQASETIFDYTNFATKPLWKRQVLQKNAQLFLNDNGSMVKIKKKTTGVVSSAAIKSLFIGAEIPELTANNILTQTTYNYDKSSANNSYGQLSSLTVVKYPESTHKLYGRVLDVNNFDKFITKKPETLTVDIKRTLNLKTGEVAIKKIINSNNADFKNSKTFSNENPINLTTEIYSVHDGLKVAEDDPLKTVRTTWSYDKWQRPIKKVTTPKLGGKSHITTWDYIYTNNENSVIITEDKVAQQKLILNGYMQVVSTWYRFKNKDNEPLEGSIGWIQSSAATYNGPKGLKSTEKSYVQGNNGTRISLTTQYGYDDSKRLVWVKNPYGQVNVVAYDDANARVLQYKVAFDKKTQKLGYLLKVVDSNLRGQPTTTYVFPFDAKINKNGKQLYSKNLQNKIQIIKNTMVPISALKSFNSFGVLSSALLIDFVKKAISNKSWYTADHFFYDGHGHKIKHIASDGATTEWIWQNGNQIAEITPDKRIIHDDVNLSGDKISRCIQLPNTSCHPLGYRKYNQVGNLIQQTDETGKTIGYVYDANGRIVKKITPPTKDFPMGNIITYKYNSIGITQKALNGKVFAWYHYDPVTWQLTDYEDNVSHLHFLYNARTLKPIKVIRTAPQVLTPYPNIKYPNGEINFNWDKYGNSTSMVDENNNKFENIFDNLGRIIKKNVYIHGAIKPTELTKNSFNIYGEINSIESGSGIVKNFIYDTLGRKASVSTSYNNKSFLKINYGYDADTGNITQLKRSEGNLINSKETNSATENFKYDITGNLTHMSCEASSENGNNLCPRETSFNNKQFILAPIIKTQDYFFDKWNNITKVQETLSINEHQNKIITKTVNYVYQQKNQLQYKQEVYNPHQMISYSEKWSNEKHSSKPHVLTYNSLGQIIKDADGNILHYNAFGEQDKFINASTHNYVFYFYDSDGHQIAEQSFDKQNKPIQNTLYMFYSGNNITRQTQKDENGKQHTSEELSGVVHLEDGVIKNWYLHNYKGDVIATLNDKGKILTDNVYSPYGMQYNLKNKQLQNIKSVFNLNNQEPWWQIHVPGFDNQMNDPATGYQFLGGGYRAYNPVYRRFMSKDSYSPFEQIDGYGFVNNNPIMNTDPTGHMPRWTGYLFGVATIAVTAAVTAVFPVAAFISTGAAASAESALSSAISAGITSSIASVGTFGLGLASGSLQIASTAKPENMNLKKATDIINVASSLMLSAIGGFGTIASGVGILTKTFQVTNSFTLAASVLGDGAAVTTGAASSMSAASDWQPSLATKKGFNEAMEALNIASGVLTVFSIASAMGTMAIAQPTLQRAGELAKNRTDNYHLAILTEKRESRYQLNQALERKKNHYDRNINCKCRKWLYHLFT